MSGDYFSQDEYSVTQTQLTWNSHVPTANSWPQGKAELLKRYAGQLANVINVMGPWVFYEAQL